MLAYIITLLIYIFSYNLTYFFTNDQTISLTVKFILTILSLVYFRNHFRFRIKFSILAIFVGALVAAEWIFFSNFNHFFGAVTSNGYSSVDIIIKLSTGVILAPIVEEFFTRFYFLRFIIDEDWRQVPLGKFTVKSFIITVLFFGLSHNMWIAGLISGILFNILFYKAKDIESCILAHSAANLLLGIYVIMTQSWHFW